MRLSPDEKSKRLPLHQTDALIERRASRHSANPCGPSSKRSHHSLQSVATFAGLVSDGSGNIYGVENAGVAACQGGNCGEVFELTQNSGTWTQKTLYIFTGGTDGSQPAGGLIRDNARNLYGTTSSGGDLSAVMAPVAVSFSNWPSPPVGCGSKPYSTHSRVAATDRSQPLSFRTHQACLRCDQLRRQPQFLRRLRLRGRLSTLAWLNRLA
jgi:hypothetical protein